MSINNSKARRTAAEMSSVGASPICQRTAWRLSSTRHTTARWWTVSLLRTLIMVFPRLLMQTAMCFGMMQRQNNFEHLLIPPLLFRREEPCRVCPVAKPPIPKTWKNVLKRLIIRFLKSCQFQGKLLPLQAERCSVHLRQYSEEKKI